MWHRTPSKSGITNQTGLRVPSIKGLQDVKYVEREQPLRSDRVINMIWPAELGAEVPSSTVYRHLRIQGATCEQLGVAKEKVRCRWTREQPNVSCKETSNMDLSSWLTQRPGKRGCRRGSMSTADTSLPLVFISMKAQAALLIRSCGDGQATDRVSALRGQRLSLAFQGVRDPL